MCPGHCQSIPLHNCSNGALLASGTAYEYSVPKHAMSMRGDGNVRASQVKHHAWFRKKLGCGTGAGWPNSDSVELGASDMNMARV